MIQFELQKRISRSTGEHLLNAKGECHKGQLLALYGRSGSGKTTILKMLAGLIRPEEGHIRINDEVMYDSSRGIWIPAQKRRIGFVFQDNALFPHLTVLRNVQFAMAAPSSNKALAILEQLGIQKLSNRAINTLSGGQKKRVAIARALAMDTEVILLDEPFSSLDISLKMSMYEMIRELKSTFNRSVILVSHDIFEVGSLADSILVFTGEKEFLTTDRRRAIEQVMGQDSCQAYLDHIAQEQSNLIGKNDGQKI